jgi:hypothetical protein
MQNSCPVRCPIVNLSRQRPTASSSQPATHWVCRHPPVYPDETAPVPASRPTNGRTPALRLSNIIPPCYFDVWLLPAHTHTRHCEWLGGGGRPGVLCRSRGLGFGKQVTDQARQRPYQVGHHGRPHSTVCPYISGFRQLSQPKHLFRAGFSSSMNSFVLREGDAALEILRLRRISPHARRRQKPTLREQALENQSRKRESSHAQRRLGITQNFVIDTAPGNARDALPVCHQCRVAREHDFFVLRCVPLGGHM